MSNLVHLNQADFQQWLDNPITRMVQAQMKEWAKEEDSLSRISQAQGWTLGELLAFQKGKVTGMTEALDWDQIKKRLSKGDQK